MKKAKTQPAESPGPSADQEGPRQFLEYLLARHAKQGGVSEVRLIPTVGEMPCVGYFKPADIDAALALLAPPSGTKSEGGKHPSIGDAVVGYNPHPVSPDLYDKSPAKFTKRKPAGPADIVAFSMLGVRVEVTRTQNTPAGGGQKPGIEVAKELISFFEDLGTSPILVQAGNRLDLLVPTIAYPEVARALRDAQAVLDLLDWMYSTAGVHVGVPGLAYAPNALLLPGTAVVPVQADRPPRFVTLRSSEVPADVDLLGLLEEQLATYRALGEPDDPPDEPDRPSEGKTSLKEAHISVDVAEAATGPTLTEPAETEGALMPVDEPPVEEPDEPAIATPTHAMSMPVAQWDPNTAARVLAGVLERGDHKYHVEDEKGERHYQFEVCPHLGEPDGHDDKCAVVVRADGRYEFRCLHSEEASWKDLKPMIGWGEQVRAVMRELGVPPRSLPYRAAPDGIYHVFKVGNRVHRTRLTNFLLRVVRDEAEDDGVEVRHTFEVEALVGGKSTRFTLSAAEFASMNWVLGRLGAQAVVFPGARPHLGPAIQCLSGPVPAESVYTHTGWCRHCGEWVYLHAGGAIGRDGAVPGVRVELPEALRLYRLPDPPRGEALAQAVRASMRLTGVAPARVTFPLYGSIYRAPLGPAGSTPHLDGPSGAGKSVLAGLVQQHFGKEMDWDHLPGSWLNTPSANELLAFSAKDVILTVDDFVPVGGASGSASQCRDADRFLRGQGNNTGRGRMRSDSTLSPSRPPRGSILSTGEAVPRGQSLRARMLVLGVPAGGVDWGEATACQQDADAGVYAAAYAGYIRWLASRYEEVLGKMPARVAALREQAGASGRHKKTPVTVANLYYGLEVFAGFAVESKALSAEEAEDFLARAWEALGEAASLHAAVQSEGDVVAHAPTEPARSFLDLLEAALGAGKAHVVGCDGKRPENCEAWGWRMEGDGWSASGQQIGWVDGPALYLDPEAAFAVAQSTSKGGEPLAVGIKTLHKRLKEGGFLTQIDKKRDRLLVRKTVAGKQREVLVLSASALVPQPQPLPPESPALPPEPQAPSPEPPAVPPGD